MLQENPAIRLSRGKNEVALQIKRCIKWAPDIMMFSYLCGMDAVEEGHALFSSFSSFSLRL